MVLVIANVRKANQSVQAGLGTTDYVRSSPSQVFWHIITHRITSIYALGLTQFGYMTELLFGTSSHITTKGSLAHYFRPTIKASENLPLSLPGFAIRFNRAPAVETITALQELGASATKITGSTRDTWMLHKPTFAALRTFISFDDLETFNPPFGFVSRRSMEFLPRIINGIYVAARVLRMLTHETHPGIFEFAAANKITSVGGEVIAVTRVRANEPLEEGEEVEGDAAVTQWEEYTLGDLFHGGIFNRNELAGDPSQVCYTIDDFPEITAGIVCPFIENAAAPDRQAFPVFLRTFYQCMFDSEEDQEIQYDHLVGAWVKEISDSAFGNWIAHMCVVIEICRSTGTFPLFVLREDGKYEGSVIVGDVAIRLAGGIPERSATGDALQNQLRQFQSHSVAIGEILRILARDDVNPNQITSMRILASIITAHGEPSGENRNAIGVQLERLNFKETPTPVTPQSMCDMMTLLTSPEMPIPTNLFLDVSGVFSVDRFGLILAQFGSTVPSFSYGGPDTVRFCQVEAKGITVDYTQVPPANLQTKRVALRAAIIQYKSVLETGVFRTDAKKRIGGTRCFTKDNNQMVWDHFGKCCEKTIRRKGEPVKRIGGGDQGEGPSTKRRRVIDFI